MPSYFRHAAIMIVTVGLTAAASAQPAPPPVAPVPAPSVAPPTGLDTGRSATPTIDPRAGLRMTEEQRRLLAQSAMKDKAKVKPPQAEVNPSVGADVPPTIELYHLPDRVTAEVPNAKLFRYTLVQNDVVVVDPTKMRVVDVIRP